MCQDWFHELCILKEYPYTVPHEGGNDFVCKDCMENYSAFLAKYHTLEYIQGVTDKIDDISKGLEEVKTEIKEGQESIVCTIQNQVMGRIGNIFLKSGWREKLCRCPRCLKMYSLVGVEYLLKEQDVHDEEEEDTTLPHQEQDLTSPDSLASLNPTAQREIATGMMEFKQELIEFLQPFLNHKRTVTARDIEDFKTGLQEKQNKRCRYQVNQ